MEYLLLLGIVVALVMVAFKTQLPRTRVSANVYFNRASLDIIGSPNPCGDGLCCPPFEDMYRCPPDCDVAGTEGCPGAACTSPFSPANAGVCTGDDTGLVSSNDWVLVPNGGCTSRKCEYQCNSGFMPLGDTCIPAVCSGGAGFANATMCANDDTGITVPTAWSVVPNGGCTSAKCEYECDPGYVQASSVDCVLAQCVGLGFGNASICSGDGVGLMADTLRTLVASCSFPDPEPKCEYTCDGLYVLYGGSCCLPTCVVGACGPGQNDGCGGTIDCPSCCGNGVINSGEQCDILGPNMNGADCASLGYPGAVLPLTCNGDCTFNVSRCTSCPAQTLDIGSGLTAVFNETLDTQTFSSSCPSGFSGTPNRTCNAGTWGALSNGCVPNGCPIAVLAVGSGLTGTFPASAHGNIVTLDCAAINSGYQGSTSATCDYGSWINLVAGCLPADCAGNVFMDPNAVVLGTFPASTHGTPVTLTCSAIDARYTGTFGRTCSYGSWLNPVGGCVAQSCPAQTLDMGSGLSGLFSAADHGGTGYASCPGGYTGVPSRVCDYGTWGALSNGCVPVTCTCPDNSIIPAGASCAGSYYQLSTVACGSSCVPETRTCDAAGVLSGSYTNASCTVGACSCPSPCGNGSIASGSTDTCYSTSSVPCGSNCASSFMTATCNDGNWSPSTFTSYTSPSCSVAACAPCTCPGGPVNGQPSGTSCPTAYYQFSSVACGSNCGFPETRACFDGNLSGSYTSATCGVALCPCPSPCGHGSIASGSTDTCYSTSSVACGGSCASVVQTATCNNALWSSGSFTSYTASSCSVAVCASCPSVCGSVLPHGGIRTCYQSSSVPCGSSCVSEPRTCNNGTATGSYANASCSVQPCCGNGSCDDGNGGRPNYGESCSVCPADCTCPTWGFQRTISCALFACGVSDVDCSLPTCSLPSPPVNCSVSGPGLYPPTGICSPVGQRCLAQACGPTIVIGKNSSSAPTLGIIVCSGSRSVYRCQ